MRHQPKDLTSTIEKIESKITSKTVGIMAVHLFGLSADIKPIMKIAKKHNLWVIEDAFACGFGTTYDGRHVGHFGSAGVFSFHLERLLPLAKGDGNYMDTSPSYKNSTVKRSWCCFIRFATPLGSKPIFWRITYTLGITSE